MKTELVTITESLGAAPQRSVDAAAGIIRGVKLIGGESVNGRIYPPAVLRAAVPQYEGAKVNVNHPAGNDPLKPRCVEDRIGIIRGVRFVEGAGGGLFGDFHYNPKHRLAEQIAWDAMNQPEALGFSHNALLRPGAVREGRCTVEEIVKVRSVDLVADPATTRSLFESENPRMDQTQLAAAAVPPAEPGKTDAKDAVKSAFRAMVIAAFDDDALDIKATLAKIRQIMQAQEKLLGGDLVKDGPNQGTEEVQLRQQLALLTQQLEQYKAKEQQAALLEAIEQELVQAGIDRSDPQQVSELFTRQLLACESADARREIIADRAALVRERKTLGAAASAPAGKPKSAMAHVTEQIDACEFARRLCGVR